RVTPPERRASRLSRDDTVASRHVGGRGNRKGGGRPPRPAGLPHLPICRLDVAGETRGVEQRVRQPVLRDRRAQPRQNFGQVSTGSPAHNASLAVVWAL